MNHKRLILTGVNLASMLFLPWTISVIVLILIAIWQEIYWEGILIALAFDLLYSAGLSIPLTSNNNFPFLTITLVISFVVVFKTIVIKARLN